MNTHELQRNAVELADQERAARNTVDQQLESFITVGGYGHLPKSKAANAIRIMFKYFNSLVVFAKRKARRKKIRRLSHLMKEYNVDVMSRCETQADWRFARERKKSENRFGKGQDRRHVVGYNTTEKIAQNQMGDTAMMALGRLLKEVSHLKVDLP